MFIIAGLIFVAAQGGIVFVTALMIARWTGARSNGAKFKYMALSLFAWGATTWGIFTLLIGSHDWQIPVIGSITALVSSFLYWIGWVLVSGRKVGTLG